MMRRPRLWRLLRQERGATLVEFAMVAIVFFTFTLAIMEFGRMILAYNIVSSSARDGARWASVRGADSGQVASVNDVKNYVVSKAVGHLTTGNVTVTWNPNNNTGSTVQVQTQFSFQSIVPLLPQNVITLSSTAKMVITN